MARGSAQSQTTFNTRPGPFTAVPRISPASTASLCRRHLATNSSSGSATTTGENNGGNMLGFYTYDARGVKISPTVVLIMSVCFIGFVTALHFFGKLYRRSSVDT